MTDVGRGQTTPSIEQRVYLRFQRKMNGNATELRKGLSYYSIYSEMPTPWSIFLTQLSDR